jgi:hypothetical protein
MAGRRGHDLKQRGWAVMLCRKIFPLLLVLALVACGGGTASTAGVVDEGQADAARLPPEIDATTRAKLAALLALRQMNPGAGPGETIDLVSRGFLGTPYQGNRLIGSADVPEQLVIDFRGLDCFTYLDYVEAIRRASTDEPAHFIDGLIATRYVEGRVGFTTRRHFFTDWAGREPVLADDVTATLSPQALSVAKQLNRKADGGAYLPGLPVRARTVTYVPAAYLDDAVVARLRTGDFIGIYAKADGLDVTHIGFFIDTPDGPMLRNASSRRANLKVVDTPFLDYVRHTPGIVVLRPRA